MEEICNLCLQRKELVNSHSIPDSLFRQIFRQGSGKAVALRGDKDTWNRFSQDSWSDSLLCSGCEQELNISFDQWGLSLFRGNVGKFVRSENGVTFQNINSKRLRRFILSILWRISISGHKAYSNIFLSDEVEGHLRLIILDQANLKRFEYPIVIARLKPARTIPGFGDDEIRSMLVAPFARQYEGFRSICFVMTGFFIEVFLDKIPKEYRNKPQLLTGSNSYLYCPYQSPFRIRELVVNLSQALDKEYAGLTTIDNN